MTQRTLYRWQSEALDAVRQAFATDTPDTTIAAVTGAGKTEVALRVMEEWTGLVTVVVPRKALMVQWRDDIDNDPFLHSHIVGRFGGGGIKGWGGGAAGRITIATLNAMRSGKVTEAIEKSDMKHLVIVDECHNLRGEKNRLALSDEITPRDAVLGLSATPHPTIEAQDVIESLCGPIRYSYRYAQALADDVIPEFVLNAVQVPLTPEERTAIASVTQKIKGVMRDYNESGDHHLKTLAQHLGMERKRLLNDATSRYSLAVRLLNQEPDTPTMVFHDTIEGVEKLGRATSHLEPAIYHSKSKEGQRSINRFLSEETNHLYSCLALSEGFNAPRVERAIMMSGPNAPLRRIQTLGRCLRGKTDEPNQIYFFYVPNTKDADGLHNLLEEGDIPSDVVLHWTMDEEGLSPISKPEERVLSKGAKRKRSMKNLTKEQKELVDRYGWAALTNRINKRRGGKRPTLQELIDKQLDDKYGSVDESFSDFMEGFN